MKQGKHGGSNHADGSAAFSGRWFLAALIVVCAAAAFLAWPSMTRRSKEDASPSAGVDPAHGPVAEHSSAVRSAAAVKASRAAATADIVSEAARKGVHEVALTASTAVREALEDARRFPELARCRQERRDCRRQLLAALEVALSYPMRTGIGEGRFGLAELEARVGPRQLAFALHENAADTLGQSSDPAERVLALALLERAEATLPPLPAEATARLDQQPPLEQRLVLGELANSPPTDRTTLEAVERLAAAGESSVRFGAIRALGASRSADALSRVLGSAQLASLPPRADVAQQVTPALVSCGSACGPVMISLLERSGPAMQLAALSAIASLDTSARTPLARDALRIVAKAHATPSIQRQLDYLERLIGS